MEIYHQYIKLRRQFGRHPKFSDEGAEMIADIRPNEEHATDYIPRNPVSSRRCTTRGARPSQPCRLLRRRGSVLRARRARTRPWRTQDEPVPGCPTSHSFPE